MRIVVKFIALFAGCFALGSAFVCLVMWGVFIALVNFYGPQDHTDLPTMNELIIHHLVYSLEMALGLLFIRWGLSGKSIFKE